MATAIDTADAFSRIARGRLGPRTRAVATTVIAFGVAALVWWALSSRIANPAILPDPAAVWRDVQADFWGSPGLEYLGLRNSSYLGNIWYTARLAVGSWVLGSLTGLVLGFLASRSQWVRDGVDPIVYTFGVLPPLVAAPFVMIWFGIGPVAQFVLVAFFSTVTVLTVALGASLNLDPKFEEYAASLGADRWRRIRFVVAPDALPACAAALRIALATAWGLQTIAEVMGSQEGVGRIVSLRFATGNTAGVLSIILLLALVCVVLDQILARFLSRLTRWL